MGNRRNLRWMCKMNQEKKKYIVLRYGDTPTKLEDIEGFPAKALPPQAVPLQDMNYVIRMRGNSLGISAFAYEVDARVMLSHLKYTYVSTNVVFELVNNTTGSVIASTEDKF
jgi:hypothetical protein